MNGEVVEIETELLATGQAATSGKLMLTTTEMEAESGQAATFGNMTLTAIETTGDDVRPGAEDD